MRSNPEMNEFPFHLPEAGEVFNRHHEFSSGMAVLSVQPQFVSNLAYFAQPNRPSDHEGFPLGQRGGAAGSIFLAADEMKLLTEVVVE